MPQYVEDGYSENYTEGDVAVVPPVVGTVDLAPLIALMNSQTALMTQQANDINTLKQTVNSLFSLVGNLPTMDYINTQIPFVDDMSLNVFPNGTVVSVAGFSEPCMVVSSSLVPHEAYTYYVVYVVSHTKDGVTRISNFANTQVIEYVASVVP
ncbi:MAG: hypothetical protein WC656_03285 [Sulfurimonas sp.]|jgi:hypothetical protein